MPIYEYRCEACGERFERLRTVGRGTEGLTCPRCGADTVTRELSTFASGSSAGSSGSTAGCGSGGFT